MSEQPLFFETAREYVIWDGQMQSEYYETMKRRMPRYDPLREWFPSNEIHVDAIRERCVICTEETHAGDRLLHPPHDFTRDKNMRCIVCTTPFSSQRRFRSAQEWAMAFPSSNPTPKEHQFPTPEEYTAALEIHTQKRKEYKRKHANLTESKKRKNLAARRSYIKKSPPPEKMSFSIPCRGGKLREDFVVPPFSVLDAKAGAWQARKREWLSMGIDSGIGRDETLIGEAYASLIRSRTGTSIFDPVLAEAAYSWYCPRPTPEGPPVIVLDPFAGGSVRGICASKLGLLYVGIDLSARQVEANRAQALRVCDDCQYPPHWVVGDGEDIAHHFQSTLASLSMDPATRADFMLTCPPFWNLEQYGGGVNDLSELPSYEAFLDKYKRILANATDLLKPQRVAVVVVGNVRNAEGRLLDLHGDTKRILKETENPLYVDAILQTALASAPMRAGRQMRAASKMVSVHQNVIVTCRKKVLNTTSCRRIGIQAAKE